MATRRLDYPIEPMDLANMRQNGVRSLEITCHQCRHKTIMNVDHLPSDLTVKSFDRAWCAPSAGRSALMFSLIGPRESGRI
jgi:hypothetical protein